MCTKFGKDTSIHSWVITTSGFGKRTAAILQFYFRFQLWPISRHRHLILHQHTKFPVNRTIGGLAMMLCLTFKMVDVSHVVFHVRLWWTTHDVPLMVWVLSSNFGLIRCKVSEIPQLLDFGNLAWKCIFTPLLGRFLEHISPKYCH